MSRRKLKVVAVAGSTQRPSRTLVLVEQLLSAISEAVPIPVIASGGAGTLDHMADVLGRGKADAVLAASIFHFGEYTVADVKDYLGKCGIPVRPRIG